MVAFVSPIYSVLTSSTPTCRCRSAKITDEAFDERCSILPERLEDHGMSKNDIGDVIAAFSSHRDQVITERVQ
jgi:hypothetical protein